MYFKMKACPRVPKATGNLMKSSRQVSAMETDTLAEGTLVPNYPQQISYEKKSDFLHNFYYIFQNVSKNITDSEGMTVIGTMEIHLFWKALFFHSILEWKLRFNILLLLYI